MAGVTLEGILQVDELGSGPSGSIDVNIIGEDGQALRFDSSASPILYLGTAVPGSLTSAAVWRIIQIDTSSGVVFLYADGNDNYDNVWDNRTGLSYS